MSAVRHQNTRQITEHQRVQALTETQVKALRQYQREMTPVQSRPVQEGQDRETEQSLAPNVLAMTGVSISISADLANNQTTVVQRKSGRAKPAVLKACSNHKTKNRTAVCIDSLQQQ